MRKVARNEMQLFSVTE